VKRVQQIKKSGKDPMDLVSLPRAELPADDSAYRQSA
jgi:hypothetical protein